MSGTRDRMIEAAVDGLRRRGVAGMSFTEVLQESGAARGAIYHHFPGGKNQLVAEAVQRHGEQVRDYLGHLPGDSPRAVVDAFLAGVRPVVAQSALGSGCAAAAVTVGVDAGSSELREIGNGALTSWIDHIAGKLTAAGMAPVPAKGLATTLITLLEGAHVLCRAAGSLEPFERMAGTVASLV